LVERKTSDLVAQNTIEKLSSANLPVLTVRRQLSFPVGDN